MLQPLLWILLGSFEVESIILDMAVSVIHIASDPVAQLCVCVCGGGDPDAWGVEHRTTRSWVSKPSLAHESVHPFC